MIPFVLLRYSKRRGFPIVKRKWCSKSDGP